MSIAAKCGAHKGRGAVLPSKGARKARNGFGAARQPGLGTSPPPTALQGLLAAGAADSGSVGARSALNKSSPGAGDWHSQSHPCHCLDYCGSAWAGGCVSFLWMVNLFLLVYRRDSSLPQ